MIRGLDLRAPDLAFGDTYQDGPARLKQMHRSPGALAAD